MRRGALPAFPGILATSAVPASRCKRELGAPRRVAAPPLPSVRHLQCKGVPGLWRAPPTFAPLGPRNVLRAGRPRGRSASKTRGPRGVPHRPSKVVQTRMALLGNVREQPRGMGSHGDAPARAIGPMATAAPPLGRPRAHARPRFATAATGPHPGGDRPAAVPPLSRPHPRPPLRRARQLPRVHAERRARNLVLLLVEFAPCFQGCLPLLTGAWRAVALVRCPSWGWTMACERPGGA